MLEGSTRVARVARDEEGKTHKVPADMKYNEWKKQYIDSNNLKIPEIKGELYHLISENLNEKTQKLFNKYLTSEFVEIDTKNKNLMVLMLMDLKNIKRLAK